ncbi:MAG: polyketide synthase, partial [Pseudomonadales bacterium]|nr:polyketide synthase [Pseudomonadales bacterium]
MKQNPVKAKAKPLHEVGEHDIAIVGMACRVPGARNYREFWTNLCAGKESLTALSDDQLRDAGVPEAAIKDASYVKAGMFLDDMRLFDPGFFGLGAQDGKIMDPQHRHFLETCWEAFEDAGVDPAGGDRAIGVFAGSGHNAYLHYNLLNHPKLLDEVGFFLLRHTGNDKDFLATRASYCFNLNGPSVNIQTACSTSLVAVHTAAQSLLNGECDLALAGGVTINLPDREGYFYKDGEILSPDGHCRPFDKDSNGTVFGSGAGVVALKRLEEALADGDNVHAVVKATAINNDGADKVSYLAPSVDGQATAMAEALELAEVDPATIGFIECHGTGTELGDPIEVAALAEAYAGETASPACAIGSVKSNIGHLDTAAGVASLIKA